MAHDYAIARDARAEIEQKRRLVNAPGRLNLVP